MALTAKDDDKYAPRKTGLYDVIIDKWSGKDSTDKNQMWFWDERDHSLRSYGHADTDAVMFEGFNKNLVLYRQLGRDSQKFGYNSSTHFWRNDHTKRAMHAEAMRAGSSVVTENVDDNIQDFAVKWSIHYCGKEPTNISAGGGQAA